MTIEVTEQYIAESVDKVIAGMKAHGRVDSLDTASMVRERYRHLESWTFQPSVYGDRLAEVEGVKAEMMAALQAALIRLEAEGGATKAPTFPRQPDHVVISPSGWSPWIGWGNTPDDRFTRAQVAEMKRKGIDPDTHGFFVTVFREATHREMVWPRGDAPPVFQFDCPVLSVTKDNRLRVIAPNGDVKIVLRNGWAHEPHYLNRHLLDRKEG